MEVNLQNNAMEEGEEKTPSIIIRVENYEEGTVYYWSTETFHNRYDLMKELFNKFSDEDLDIQNLKKEDDPLWDEAKPVLLGYAFYRLEPVSYLMSNESQISVVSPNGEVVGKIEVDIIPHDENGLEFDEVPETPNELIGQTLLYKVVIMNLQNIAKNFSYDVHVEYQCFYDHSILKTKVYNEFKENDDNDNLKSTNNTTDNKNNLSEDEKVDIEINESFEHKIDYLTKEDIDFLVKDKVCFIVYSSERIEKKGKTPLEEIFNTRKDSLIKEPEEEIKIIEDKKQNNFNINDNYINNVKDQNEEPVDIMVNKNSNYNNNRINNKRENQNMHSKSNNKKDKKDNCNIF